jgi:hypothetical protein
MGRGSWCANGVNKAAVTSGIIVAVSLLAGCGTQAAVPAADAVLREPPERLREPPEREPKLCQPTARGDRTGYAQTKSGRHVVFMIAVDNVPISTAEEFLTVTDDQARPGGPGFGAGRTTRLPSRPNRDIGQP